MVTLRQLHRVRFALALCVAVGVWLLIQPMTAWACGGDVICVDADATGAATGLSWTNAFTNVQDALGAATSGDEIWVAEGVYYPDEGVGYTNDDPAQYFALKNGVELYGGFAATETMRTQRDWQANQTVLSGDIGQDDIYTGTLYTASWSDQRGTNAIGVIVGSGTDATARLDGFIITAGYALVEYGYGGGGIYIYGGNPQLYNLELRGNYANWNGGGIYVTHSNPASYIENVWFEGNATCLDDNFCYGGGMSIRHTTPVLVDVTFKNNRSRMGGGLAMTLDSSSGVIINGAVFSENVATAYGGGMTLWDSKDADLQNVTFSRNKAAIGGGIYAFRSYQGGVLTISHTTFIENTSSGRGGGIYVASMPLNLSHSTLISNTAVGGGGGGIFSQQTVVNVQNTVFRANAGTAGGFSGGGGYTALSDGRTTMTNVSFNDNSAPGFRTCGSTSGNPHYVTLCNAILWGNGGQELVTSYADPGVSCSSIVDVSYSNIWLPDGVYPGTDNQNQDPLFVSPATGNLQLSANSPMLDIGDATVCPATDRLDVSRPQGAGCDLGAYELEQSLFLLKTVTPTLNVPYHSVVTYTLTLSNAEALSDPVWFTDTLPVEVVFGGWVENHGAQVTGDLITWNGSVPAPKLTFIFTATHVGNYNDLVENIAQFSGPVQTQSGASFYVECLPAPTVQNANDSGLGSLRQAIMEVCTGGEITFNDNTSLYLESELLLDRDIMIDGSGHAVLISGDSGNDGGPGGLGNVRVFNIAAGNTVTLSHLTIVSGTHSTDGGGIYNAGDLTVESCMLAGNTAGDNGGGIRNVGVLVLRNSTLSGNAAQYGGGINGTGDASLYNSTLSGNTGNTGAGGGIRQWDGTLRLYNTILANSAAGGDCRVNNNSVIAANVHNLIEDGSCSAGGVGFLSADPLLGPLADNGGETLTHALLPNSPAIDAGDPATCLATDQRGFPRADLRCDIGAFELQHADSDTVIKTGMTSGAQASFGPTFISVTVTGGNAGTITATKHITTPGGVYDTGEITATWYLEANQEPFTATLAFCYTPDEIAGLSEGDLRAFHWDTTEVAWTLPISTGLTVADGCVTLTGIETFSAWTLKDTSVGAATPTAARVVVLAARGFASVAALLLALGGAVIGSRRRK